MKGEEETQIAREENTEKNQPLNIIGLAFHNMLYSFFLEGTSKIQQWKRINRNNLSGS